MSSIARWDRGANSRMIIDACIPYHWRDDFPEINQPSAETAHRAREKFGYLLA